MNLLNSRKSWGVNRPVSKPAWIHEYTIDGEWARIVDEEARSGRASDRITRFVASLSTPYFHGCTASRNGTTTENSNIRVCADPSAVFHTAHVKKLVHRCRVTGRGGEGRVSFSLYASNVSLCQFDVVDIISALSRIFVHHIIIIINNRACK